MPGNFTNILDAEFESVKDQEIQILQYVCKESYRIMKTIERDCFAAWPIGY
jgi:hypothetical protein